MTGVAGGSIGGPAQWPLAMTGGAGRQLALPLDEGSANDSDLIVTTANEAAVRLLTDAGSWPSHTVILTGPRKSGRSLHARLAARRTGARVIDRADTLDELPLFDVWNDAAAASRPLILVADRAPPDWSARLPDLRSRLASCPVARLSNPDDRLADALLEKLLWRRGVTSGPAVRRDALTAMERTHVAIWRFAEAVEGGAPLTRGAVRAILAHGQRLAA